MFRRFTYTDKLEPTLEFLFLDSSEGDIELTIIWNFAKILQSKNKEKMKWENYECEDEIIWSKWNNENKIKLN